MAARPTPMKSFASLLFALLALSLAARASAATAHSFEIGDTDFLLDGQRLQIRCGEIHFARVPPEYWRHRLRLAKAMGLNTICAYLFWNYHEWEEGNYDWSGPRDAAEFCRIAQEEGLWVILRPGPYACAEWEMGGLPWWLLKKSDSNFLRTRDPLFLAACRRWFAEVSRVMAPLQVTRGGPILMVQVENEYGYFGHDPKYMPAMRQIILDAGFNVPLFACNPTSEVERSHLPGLFSVANFGSDPEKGFQALRQVQPKGPLMCGEYYAGWFDIWGKPHKTGSAANMLADLDTILSQNGSFSLYMAHGGTTFGLWGGCDRPFQPDTSSYDYDAPISEAGWITPKFTQFRTLMGRHLMPGEKIPEPPKENPVMAIAEFPLGESAAVFANLPGDPIKDSTPRNLEAYNISRGVVVYRATLPAGPAGFLEAENVRDLAWVYLDGRAAGVMDVRTRHFKVQLPARTKPARIEVLLYTIARVNFGIEVHDRKGLQGPVRFTALDGSTQEVNGWEILPIDFGADARLPVLHWEKGPAAAGQPAFWRGSFNLATTADTFLDLSKWGLGIVWVNGHCLGRYWNIGPTQTMYLPGPWLKIGANEIIVLDLTGPEKPTIQGLKAPILNQLRPQNDFYSAHNRKLLQLTGLTQVQEGEFATGAAAQEIKFARPATGRQFCLESVDAFDGNAYAAAAEIQLLDEAGNILNQSKWTIAYADSEEDKTLSGSAVNAINGQAADAWHTEIKEQDSPAHPHRLIIDLGATVRLSGFRYTPRQGPENVTGRIKTYRIYCGDRLAVDP